MTPIVRGICRLTIAKSKIIKGFDLNVLQEKVCGYQESLIQMLLQNPRFDNGDEGFSNNHILERIDEKGVTLHYVTNNLRIDQRIIRFLCMVDSRLVFLSICIKIYAIPRKTNKKIEN